MIGMYIRELRKQKGYSLTKLAEMAGVSKSYLSYIERDIQKNPSLQFLSKIAEPLNVSIEHFLLEGQTKDMELDSEWHEMVQRAIHEGMRKEDFLQYREFMKYANWKKENENIPHSE